MVIYKSINQKNSTLEEREQYFFADGICNVNFPNVWIQTCNRMELYYGDGDIDEATMRHLFRVCSGLESAIIGERAVQGQVKKAYEYSCAHYNLSVGLNKLFQTALYVGKRVRNETAISTGAVSHSQAVVELMQRKNIDFRHAFISIIGVNKLTEDMLKFLKNKGATLIFLGNRNREKAECVAKSIGGTEIGVFSLDERKRFLDLSDVVISATSAPHLIINEEDVAATHQQLFIDLAFPRDIDPDIASKLNVSLYNLNDVEQNVAENMQLRIGEMEKANQIIDEEIEKLKSLFAKRHEMKGARL